MVASSSEITKGGILQKDVETRSRCLGKAMGMGNEVGHSG